MLPDLRSRCSRLSAWSAATPSKASAAMITRRALVSTSRASARRSALSSDPLGHSGRTMQRESPSIETPRMGIRCGCRIDASTSISRRKNTYSIRGSGMSVAPGRERLTATRAEGPARRSRASSEGSSTTPR
eukprot:Amastigsp_a682217_4.p3 type:complete len:132 gc:universal Amastigsp_a682217_4:429-34(-)